MKFEDYTKPQQKAITEFGHNIIVSAGAGSGKTQVLTERVIHFVRDEKFKLKDFLILTFTKLAASEMKERIRKTLLEEGLDEYKNVDISDICNFDSFALSIVKKYHFLLGVSPNVSIVQGTVVDVKKRQKIDELFEEEYKKRDSVFVDLIKTYCFKDDDVIKKIILSFYNKTLEQISPDKFLNNFCDTYYSQEKVKLIKNELVDLFKIKVEGLIKDLEGVKEINVTCKEQEFSGSLQNFYKPYFEQMRSCITYEDFVQIGDIEIPTTKIASKNDEEDQKIKKNYVKKVSDIISYFNKIPKNEAELARFLVSTKPIALKFIEIIKKLDVSIKEFKNKYQVYEFSDIARMSLLLVKNNKDVKEEIKNAYKMIMIDEYQDTSLIQDAFIMEISNNNVYMVGDIKQSIYRFRHARCDIFIDKYENYKKGNGGVAIDLNRNFRSRKEVLEDINYIFKQLMTKEIGGADYLNEHVIEYGNKNYLMPEFNKQDFHSTVLISKRTPEDEAKSIALDIINKINSGYLVLDYVDKKPIARKCKFSDFCILMDRGSDFDVYAKVFKEWKIPLFIVKDEDLKNVDVILVLRSILVLIKCIKENDLESAEFKKAYLSVARSFVYCYTDSKLYSIFENNSFNDDEIIIEFRNLIYKYNHLSIAGLFKQMMLELGVYHKAIKLGEINSVEKYLDTFIEYFETMCELDYSIDEFINFLDCIDDYDLKMTLQFEGTSENNVTLMNIHKSKGLEFGIVYFSGQYKEFNRNDIKNKFKVSEDYGLILPPADNDDVNLLNELYKAKERKEDTAEKLRLFYVALTRTKEKMIFVTQYDGDSPILHYFIARKLVNNARKIITEKNIYALEEEEIGDYIIDLYNKGEIDYITLDNFLITLSKYYFGCENIDLDGDIKEQLEAEYALREEKYKNEYGFIEELKNRKLPNDEILRQVLINSVNSNGYIEDVYEVAKYLRYHINGEDKWEFKKNIENDINKRIKSGFDDDAAIECVSIDTSLFSKYRIIDTFGYEFRLILRLFKESDNLELVFKILEIEPAPRYSYKEAIEESMFMRAPLYFTYEEEKDDIYNLIFKHYDIFEKLDNSEKIRFIDYIRLDNPYSYEIKNLILNLNKKKIDLVKFKEVCKAINLEFDYDSDLELELVYKGNLAKYQIENFINVLCHNVKFNKLFLNEDYIYNFKPIVFPIMIEKFKDFQNGKISYQNFVNFINLIGYEENIMFKILPLEEKISFKFTDFDEVVCEIGFIDSNYSDKESFYDFFKNYMTYRRFTWDGYGTYFRKPLEICTVFEEIKHENLKLNEFKFEPQEVNTFKASKELKLDSNKKAMEFGTKIHFIMEVVDFKNPDYTKLPNFFQNIVKRFLSSDLMKNIKDGEIYKELEFYDEVNLTNGIIDLMVIYDDHIDIIDYKTRNIDDESYDEQLRIYKRYIKQKSDKEIRTYLYSLETGECRETK